MAESVLNEGQWSLARFLKPFPGFEAVYQGKASTTPVAFPGTLDSYAQRGVPGYEPTLLAGYSVPLGARITLWIPLALDGGDVYTNYTYQILWRMRTISDFVVGQSSGQESSVQEYSSYHIGTGPLGQPQTINDPATQRFFLPGAMQTLVSPVSPIPSGGPATDQLFGQLIQPASGTVWTPPLTPQGKTAAWQQGMYPLAANNQAGPAFMVYTLDALGDQMTILASRAATEESPTWDFTSGEPGDVGFSATYGNNNGQAAVSPYSAILLFVGTR